MKIPVKTLHVLVCLQPAKISKENKHEIQLRFEQVS